MANSGLRAGHKATVADFDAIGVWAIKTSTESVTSSTTLQNDDQLVVPMLANYKYAFEAYLIYDGSTAGDLKAAFTVPSGATLNWTNFAPNSGGTLVDYNAVVQTSSGATRNIACNGATVMSCQPKGYVGMGSTAGNLQLQWAQVASNATATRIFLGSWIRLTRIA